MNQIDFHVREPLLELDSVAKTYVIGNDVRVEALRGVSLAIWPGEFVAIMGPSGSGKSTLMHILGCLDRPSAGAYRVQGRDVAEMDSDALAALRRDAFGFIFQGYNLLPTATAQENVEIPAIYAGLPAGARKARADALLTQLGMGERLDHRPNQLSGGQQQRVGIARALMNGGEIILADEPTGALDSKSGAEVMALLKDFAAGGHTVILITHDPKVAAHADRVIEISDGAIISDQGARLSTAIPLTREERFAAGEQNDPVDRSKRRTPEAKRRAGEGASGAGLLAGESLHMAMRALRANVFRTVLTLLGIVIGVASVVTMLAIGEGSREKLVAQIGQMGTNLLIVRPQFRNAHGYNGAIASLNEEDAQEIAKLPYVSSALPLSNSSATVRYNDIDYQTQITSTTDALPRTRSWPVEKGIFFDRSDQTSFATVAVLGQTVKGVLFPNGENPIGQYVLINNVPFQVIGVMAAKGASANGNDSDDVIFVPLTTGMLRVSGENFIRSITVAVTDLSKMAFVQDAVTRLITARHNGAEDFQIRNLADVIQAASAEQDTMTLLLGSVAAISLLVGGIGIMNIMLVSVVERTREIGIRMATGARQRDVLRQFLAEAIMVSCLGGVAGVIVGIGAGLVVRTWFDTPAAFTPGPMLLAFGCATITGLIFGYAPARKAARLDPVVALSSD